MSNIDSFSVLLFEEAKRFLEKGKAASGEGQIAFFHAATLLGFSALEAHVNAIADEHLLRSDLTLHERAILLERDVKLSSGVFVLGDLKIYRLEDRIEFLCQRFGKGGLDKNAPYWSGLKEAIKLRNNLTHPKDDIEVSHKAVETALMAILELLNALYKDIYKKPYPAFGRRLDSNMSF